MSLGGLKQWAVIRPRDDVDDDTEEGIDIYWWIDMVGVVNVFLIANDSCTSSSRSAVLALVN